MDGHDALVACLHLSKSFFCVGVSRHSDVAIKTSTAGRPLSVHGQVVVLFGLLFVQFQLGRLDLYFFLDLKKIIIKPRFPWNREFHRSDFPFYLLFFLGAAVHYHTTLSCSLLTLGEKEKENWSSEKLKAFISRSGALLFHIFVLPLGFPSPGGGRPAVSR